MDVGDAIGASADGRYLIGPAGERRDRTTDAVFRPDLALGPDDRVRFQDASQDASVYVVTVTSDTEVGLRRVLVDATTRRTTEPGAMGVSPNGRYVAFEDRVVERAGTRVRRVLPDDERAIDVADDGSHLVWSPDGGPTALRALDGALLRAGVALPGTGIHLPGDLRLALVEDQAVPGADDPTAPRASRLAGARIVDQLTGASLPLADTTTELSIGVSRIWALAADGESAVVQTRYCPNLFDCSADPPRTIPGLRALLAAVPAAVTPTTAPSGS